MRILYIHQHFTTPRGASGIRSYQMARRLIAAGHSVTMVCGRGAQGKTGLVGAFRHGVRRGQVDGIDVVEIDLAYSNHDGFVRRSVTFLRFMLRTIKVVLLEKYDILFATTTPLTVGVPGVLGRWVRGKPFVFEVRDLWPELPRALGVIRNRFVLAALSALEWASYRSAHRLIGLSPGIVAGIKARGVSGSRIALVPNGCDLDIFALDGPSWAPPGVEKGDLLALFSGTHGLANGLDSVLDAAARLKALGRSDIKIVLVGDGMLKSALRARAASEGLDNVIFVDPVPKAELAGLMRRADIGIQTLANVPAFYFGTSPNKFFDYIAAGLPVLNNYPGWLAEMIDAEQCGYAVPPDDAVRFAEALCHAADHREMLDAMGRRAQALARAQFDRAILSDQWLDWVIGAASARPARINAG
jgi:glycosyltransferase involved in cell wall biosynthesis